MSKGVLIHFENHETPSLIIYIRKRCVEVNGSTLSNFGGVGTVGQGHQIHWKHQPM